jgi:hypothetical protein
VGSGCLIEYTDRRRIKENVHDELMTLVAKRRHPPKSRFGDQPKWLFQLKSIVKAALGRREVDLYDLQAWTLFKCKAAGIVAGEARRENMSSRWGMRRPRRRGVGGDL